MHSTTLEILKEILRIGLIPEVTVRCYQVNFICRISLIKLISTPLTYSPEKLLFDGFVPRKKHKNSHKERESDAHFPYHSAHSSLTNVLCISNVL